MRYSALWGVLEHALLGVILRFKHFGAFIIYGLYVVAVRRAFDCQENNGLGQIMNIISMPFHYTVVSNSSSTQALGRILGLDGEIGCRISYNSCQQENCFSKNRNGLPLLMYDHGQPPTPSSSPI